MRVPPPRALLILLATALPGCVPYVARPLDPARSAVAFDARWLDDPAVLDCVRSELGDALGPDDCGWDTASLTIAATLFNPDLAVRRAESGTASAAIQTAGQRPNPTVSIAPSYDAATSDTGSTVSVTTGVDFPIETAGKRGYRISAATRRADATELRAEQALWETRSRIHEALLDLTAGALASELAAHERALAQDRVTIEEKRLAAGASPRLDLLAVRSSLVALAAAEARIRRDAGASRARLAAAVGVPAGALEAVALRRETLEPLPAPEDLPASAIRRTALVRHPQLRAALATYAAAEEDLRLEVAKQYPDLHLGPGFAWDQGQARWALGLGFELPLFARNRGPIAEAEARRAEEAARFEALQARILQDVDAALAAYRDAAALARAVAKAEDAVRARSDVVARLFEAGEVGRADLVDARLELAREGRTRLDALVEAHRALVSLEGAAVDPRGGRGTPLQLTGTGCGADEGGGS